MEEMGKEMKAQFKELVGEIERVSHTNTCDRWNSRTPYFVWACVNDLSGGEYTWISSEVKENIKQLIDKLQGWAVWDYERGEQVYISLEQWTIRFNEWVKLKKNKGD